MTTAAVQQTVRQQVLVLYLASSALDSRTVGWSTYDGTGETCTKEIVEILDDKCSGNDD